MNFLIDNVHVLTMNAALDRFERGCVAVEGDRIAAVGDERVRETYKGFERIDGRGGILIPGLVNAHTHSGMIPFRSLGDDCPDRLRRLLFPLEASMTARLARASARYACCEMILSGTTTFVDMYYFEDDIARAVKEAGLRALLGETVVDFPACDAPEPHGGLAYAEAFIPKWLGDELIVPMVAPHGTNTNSPGKIVEAHRLAERYGLPMTMHVSEMDYEVAHFRDKYGMTPIAFLDSLGVLDERFLAAHCVLADEADLDLLAARGTAVAHCIGANTKSAKGVAPVKAMLERGIPVALGTDGPASGNTLDLFTQFDLFAKFHKTAGKDRSAFPAAGIVRLATSGAAAALGLDDRIGSIEVGKKADLVLVETDSANMFPIFDPYAVLVYSAKAANVDSVFVDGRPLLRGKRLVALDLADARAELDSLMGDFRARAAGLLKEL
jgi:cytosine/adenosine deaminase-related metal-dependent hydrolase